MKKILKVIVNFFAWLLSLVFNNFIISINKKIKYKVIGYNAKRLLKKCGKNFSIKDHNLFEGLNLVEIGNNFCSHDGLWIGTYGNDKAVKIRIGDNVRLSRNCHIASINGIEIGDNVLFGSNILVSDHSHGQTDDITNKRYLVPLVSKGKIKIGNNCWICDNAVILPNVTLGNNCVVAANSVVNKSFPDNSVIAGSPAKLIKTIGEEKNE